MSPSGSFMAIAHPPSPARLDQARDQPPGAEIPKRDARQAMLAIEPAGPARYLAAIANAGRRGVARQFRELERFREAILHPLRFLASNGPEASAPPGLFLTQILPPAVVFDCTFLCHPSLLALRR